MKTREEIQNMVWDKIREITGDSSVLFDSHTSDDQFIELVEYFLPQIDETPDGQEVADSLFVLRSFNSVENDEILDSIKSLLGSLDTPNSKEYVEKTKLAIKKNIFDYKMRKDQ